MGRAFDMDFPPWITPVFAIHLLNALLLFLLLRRIRVSLWCALAATAFFTLSGAALDAYWKPMYVFDLLCTTFSLSTILLWTHRRWILSFVAFWLAYKAKELAVMLPAVLAAYEFWLGERRFLKLIPFLAASLSFGLGGILLNPNKDNDYTFRFTFAALGKTLPFYAQRFLLVPFSGLALLPLALIPDRRVWFGLAATALFLFTLLFLPGRLFEAYAYLPLAGAALAIGAAATHAKPWWIWIALALWLPWNVRQIRHEQNVKLARDDETFAFVDQLLRWEAHHPGVRTLVYTGAPGAFHDWGVTGAWNIGRHTAGLPALWIDWPQTAKVLAEETVAYATWDRESRTLTVQIHSPK